MVGKSIGQARQAEAGERGERFPGSRGLAVQRELQTHVLQQSKEREQIVRLVDEANVAASKIGSIILGEF